MTPFLKEFLSIPSVSTEEKYRKDILHCVDFLEGQLSSFMKVERWEGKGHPVLFATYLEDPSKPTLLFYSHYDVQPVDPLEEWESDPFKPEVRGGAIYARGAQDNKGQLSYVFEAIHQFIQEGGGLNIKWVIEGEEEAGSSTLTHLLKDKGKLLRADYGFVVDSEMSSLSKPMFGLSLRGILTLTLKCRGSKSDLHSGLWGGIAYNPNRALIELLASCYGQDGRVIIPGFYDGIDPMPLEDLATHIDYKAAGVKEGITAFCSEARDSLLTQNWMLPTLEINGISGGYAGDGFKTVIPKEAMAKISCRLVAGQKSEHIKNLLEEYLKKKSPQGIELSFHFGQSSDGFRVSPQSRGVQAAKHALEESTGKNCGFVYGGASIPIVPLLQQASQAELVCIGTGLPSDSIHAPNEHFSLEQLRIGKTMIGKILKSFCKWN
ncbi:MAG: M20/M25/M40 family metallo-hydrolase [Simkaniaceae bacterium]|nr:M20/M25/M40 family metallo-hydrolase [Simkaniaceae bacterium]